MKFNFLFLGLIGIYVHRTLKAQCIKIHFRDEILDLLEFCLWINASSFFSKKICDWNCVAWRRRFSQSKFHFDFEDDLPQGLRRLWLLIPFLAKIAV